MNSSNSKYPGASSERDTSVESIPTGRLDVLASAFAALLDADELAPADVLELGDELVVADLFVLTDELAVADVLVLEDEPVLTDELVAVLAVVCWFGCFAR